MAADQAKQQALIGIVNGAVKPEFTALSAQVAKLQIDVGAILARLETLDGLAAQGAGANGVKRTVKTGGGAKKGGKAANGAPKLTNALLYFRYKMSTDEEFRGQYTPADDDWKGHAQLANKDEEKDPQAYWSAAGTAIWAKLDAPTKEEIKAQLAAYKEELARGSDEAQLEAD